MPGSSATVMVPEDSGLKDPTSEEGISTRVSNADLSDLWRDLKQDMENQRMALERDERFSHSPISEAYKIAFSHPNKVDIKRDPFGRGRNLTEHVRNHFEALLNRDSSGASFVESAIPDYDNLLRACELVYIDDGMYRFSDETIFSPSEDGLEDIGFNSMPIGAKDDFINWWHSELDIVWHVLLGDLAEGIHLEEEMNKLYERRSEFIDHCKGYDVFMPITVNASGSADAKKKNIKRHLRRGNNVDPKLVHEYCFLNFKEI